MSGKRRWRSLAPGRRRLCGALVVLALIGASAVGASADTKSELEAAEDELEQVREQLDAEQRRLDALQTELNALASEIATAQGEHERLRLEAIQTRRRIDTAERRLEGLQSRLNEHARDAYMNGAAGGIAFVLGATSLADLSARIEFLGAGAQQDVDVATEVQNQLNLLEQDRAELDRMLERQAELLDQLGRQQQNLRSRFAEQRRVFDRMEALQDEAAVLVRRLEGRLEAEQAAVFGSVVVGGPGPLYACPVAGPHAYASTFGQLHT
ncbi:MAG: coiled-coil domain-containing protein, partial [Actinomycetota bacterium]